MPREVDLRSVGSYQPFLITSDELPPGAEQDTRPLPAQALDLVGTLTRSIAGAQDGPELEFAAHPTQAVTSLGATTIHMTQVVRAIPVFFAHQTVRFGVHGAMQRGEGRFVAAPASPSSMTRTAELAAEEAVRFLAHAAADEPALEDAGTGIDLEGFVGRAVAEFTALPVRPTVLEPGPLAGPIQAQLTWLPVGTRLRLCWELMVPLSDAEGAYQVLVATDDPQLGEPSSPVLLSGQVIAAAGSALVYDVAPTVERVARTFPRPWSEYGVGGGSSDPVPEWVSGATTEGYSNRGVLAGVSSPVVASDDGPTFAPTDPLGDEAKVVNAFYYACWMHDWFYARGVREHDGSWQDGGVSHNGQPCRKLLVQASDSAVIGTACFWAASGPPALKLGPDVGTATTVGTKRSTALDRTVISHEYTHAVAARLINNGTSLAPWGTENESRGLNEGTADFIAVTVTGQVTIGSWVKDAPTGMRPFAYDVNFPRSTNHYGKLASLSVYGIGQVWCATLLAVSAAVGVELTVQLLLDSLRGLPAAPRMLSARDGMASALHDRLEAGLLTAPAYAVVASGLDQAFQSFGMGPAASGDDGYSADGPPDLVL